MNAPEYLVVCTPRLDDDAALTVALDAAWRRRPREQRVWGFVRSEWRITALPSRVYRVTAPRPGWDVRRAWGRS